MSEKSKTSSNNNKTPTSSNNIDFPRPNSNPNSHLKPNAYTRDVIISSQPTKCHFKGYFGNDRKKKLKESSKKTDALKSKPGQPMKVEVPIELNLNSHVNFAYDNEILFDAMKPGELKSHIIAEKTAMNPYFAKNNIDNEYFQSSSQTHSDDFLIESQLQNFQLGRRESAQHIPQSFERQMAKNFQNLTTNSSPTDSYSLDTSIETSNQNSKYTDSTSICTDHSLKDEDAWLPILNIAEEEVCFSKIILNFRLKFKNVFIVLDLKISSRRSKRNRILSYLENIHLTKFFFLFVKVDNLFEYIFNTVLINSIMSNIL